jgi:hypothetical protein
MSDETKRTEAEPDQETELSARVDAIESKLREYGVDSDEYRSKQQSRRSILHRQIDALMRILESDADAQTKLAVSREITVLRGLQPRRAPRRKAHESSNLLN